LARWQHAFSSEVAGASDAECGAVIAEYVKLMKALRARPAA
jgi:hypothetical protein